MKRVVALILVCLMICILPAWDKQPVKPAAAEEEGTAYTLQELLALWHQIGGLLKENGYYPFVQLHKGDTGYEVRLLQVRLSELGYYHKALADNFGSGTYAGMRMFEKVNGLPVDGNASVEDQQLLFSKQAIPNYGYEEPGGEMASPTPTPASTLGEHKWPDGLQLPDLHTPKPTDGGIKWPGGIMTIKPPSFPLFTPDIEIEIPDIDIDIPHF